MADLEKFPCWQIQKFVSQISYIVVVCEMIGADSGSPEKSEQLRKSSGIAQRSFEIHLWSL
jgi:hypothetical protein